MAQITSGVRRLLGAARVYDAVQWLLGAEVARKALARDYIQARAGEHLLDIGCGTGSILAHLPDVAYYGFDPSADYIAAARRQFGQRGSFWQEHVNAATLERIPRCDIVLALSVLHHLDDAEAVQLFKLAAQALQPTGRLITLDPCFVEGQRRLARLTIRLDRGQNVRGPAEYAALARTVFPEVRAQVRHDLLHIPYSHTILVCSPQPTPRAQDLDSRAAAPV